MKWRGTCRIMVHVMSFENNTHCIWYQSSWQNDGVIWYYVWCDAPDNINISAAKPRMHCRTLTSPVTSQSTARGEDAHMTQATSMTRSRPGFHGDFWTADDPVSEEPVACRTIAVRLQTQHHTYTAGWAKNKLHPSVKFCTLHSLHCGAKKLHRFIFAISLSNQAIF